MLALLFVCAAWAAIATLTSLVLGLRGVYSLISGRLTLWGSHLTGQDARLGAIFLAGQLVLAVLVASTLHEARHWGRGGDLMRTLESHFGNAVIFTLAAGGAYVWALAFARAHRKAT